MKGTRIIDCTRVLAGPWATQQLADQGADVIKIEPPGGDETRGYGPIEQGTSTYFQALNRNKRSVELDLRTPAGQDALDVLLAGADVLVDNVRAEAAARLGLDAERIRARHPHLVHVTVRGFGDDAPDGWASRPGYDIVIQALSGGMSLTGFPDGPPVRSALPIADLIAGLLVTQAVLLGLLEQRNSGIGGHTIVDMMQANAASLVYHATRETLSHGAGGRLGNAHAGLVPYDVYRCADGWLALGCGNDRIWKRLVRALDLPDLPELARNPDRVAQRTRVDALVADALAPLTRHQADALLAEAGVPAAPVSSVAEAVAHPAVHNVTVRDGERELVLPGPTLRTATTRSSHRAPPALGAHTVEVLREAGLSDAAIQALSEDAAR